MRHISPAKSALSVGGVLGLYHLTWATLVLAGWAQPLLDLVLRLHFIRLTYEMAPFSFGTAATLVAVTFALGALFGLVFAGIWNWLSDQESEMQQTDNAAGLAR